MKHAVLPADTYVVINKTILSDQDRKLLTMLYQPILGNIAISLYFTLWSYLDKSELISKEWTHHHLMTSMRLKLTDIEEAREKLEAVGLIKTYYKKNHVNHFVYVMYSPLSVSEFLKNPILSTSLYNNVGDTEYKNIIEYFKIPHLNLKDYEDISCKFDEVFEVVPDSNLDNLLIDIKRKNISNLQLVSKIDIESVVSLIPDELLNKNSITNDTKDLIYKLAFVYDLSEDDMSELIRNSINERKIINKELLRKNAKNYYQFENSGKLPSLVYRKQPEYLRKPLGDNSPRAKIIYQFETTSPYDLLVRKYKGAKLTKNDKEVLAMLAIDMNLKPGVINVLLDYVLKINDNKLTKNFVETIASQWKMAGIETVTDAMAIAEKEYKKRKQPQVSTKTKKEVSKPAWFGEHVEATKASDEEILEIESILSNFE